MNPYERRIIHSTLQNDKFVATKSEGEEPYRKVVVYLKKNEKYGSHVKDGRKYVPIQRKEGDTGDVKTSSLITTYHKTKEENVVYMWNGSKFIKICKV